MISKEERAGIATRAYKDPAFFCSFFLPRMFPLEMPPVHLGLLAVLTRRAEFLLDHPDVLSWCQRNFVFERDGREHKIFDVSEGQVQLNLARFTLIMLPRGFSKTTIAGIAVPLMKICYLDTKFLAYVSESGPHAEMQLGNVKRELETNQMLRAIFGDLVPSGKDPQKWASQEIETRSGVTLVARGRGGQIRGLNKGAARPDQIIVDDVEDKESVSTEEQRKKVRGWAYGDLMPALPELDPAANLTALGTLLHPEALLEVWGKDEQFTVVKFGAQDKEGNWLWPALHDAKKDEQKKASFAKAGELSTYYMEFHNTYRASELQAFRQDMIIRAMKPVEPLRCATYVDPAISERRKADHCVIVTVGMTLKGKIGVLSCFGGIGVSPREAVDEYFRQSSLHLSTYHGVETNAYQAALVHLLREEMFRKKRYFEITKVTNSEKKQERIKGILQPRFAAGYIEFWCDAPKIVEQLLDFPNNTKWDYIDALAGAVALLDPFAAAAAGDKDLGDDEFPPIEQWLDGTWGGSP